MLASRRGGGQGSRGEIDRPEGAGPMPELAIAGGAPVRAEPYPQWPHGDDEDVAAVEEVVRGGRWGGFPEPGPKAPAVEEPLAATQGARHYVLTCNAPPTTQWAPPV